MPVLIPAISSATSSLTSGISGLISGGIGYFQKRKGNKLLNSLQYPTEQMPTAVAGLENQGLPSEQYQKAMQDIQRQQQNAISAAQDRRGGLATIGNIQQGTNDATLNLNAKDAEMNINNRRYIAGIQRDLFDKNIRDKYNRDYSYGMGLVGMGNQNMMAGLDKLVGGGGMAASNMTNSGGSTKKNSYNPDIYKMAMSGAM